MFIQTEATPNPATLKFLPGQEIYSGGSAEFRSPERSGNSPLAQRLFALDGVSGVFLGKDFVSVSKTSGVEWSDLKPLVLAALMEHLSTGQPIVAENYTGSEERAEGEQSEIELQIRELIDSRVRPMVAMDGGDIVYESFEDGVVYLRMKGACSGCPSSTATLKAGIENMLKHFIPEVKEVRPAQD